MTRRNRGEDRDPLRFGLESLEGRILLSADGSLPEVSLASPKPEQSLETAAPAPAAGAGGGAAMDSATGLGGESAASGAEHGGLAPLSTAGELPGEGRGSGAGLQAVSGIAELVNPAQAEDVVLAPGRVSFALPASAAGRLGLWRVAIPMLPIVAGSQEVSFSVEGLGQVPTDVAVAWYDEAGNLLGVADESGAATSPRETLVAGELSSGRTYLVAVHSNRAVAEGAFRWSATVRNPALAAAVTLDPRSGQISVDFSDLQEALQSAADIHWHPLGLLNAGSEATITVTSEVVGRELELTVFRRVPPSQQLAGSSTGPAYTRLGSAVSSGPVGAEFVLRAPTGETLGEQEYVIAVAGKDFAGAAAGYRVAVRSVLPLPMPASLAPADVAGAKPFVLRPTLQAGVADAELKGESVVGDAARYFSFRAAADGSVKIGIESRFDARIGLYSPNRGLLAVATKSVGGVVTLTGTVNGGDLYYVRVINGPESRLPEATGFNATLTVPTAPGVLNAGAPAGSAVVNETGQFTIGVSANSAPTVWDIRPAPGVDIVFLRVQPSSNSAARIAMISVDGYVERTFAVGASAILPFVISTPGAPIQALITASGGFGTLFNYATMTLPRELPIGSLVGRTLDPQTGDTGETVTGFDRAGDRAAFEFYQGLVGPGAGATWTAQGSGGALPVLAQYVATGSVLKLVRWVVPDDTAKAQIEFQAQPDRLYGVVAYQPVRFNGGTVRLDVNHPVPVPVPVGMVPDLVYEQANPNLERFRYILQIRSAVLEKTYEQDYWETLLPSRFFGGNFIEDPAMPVLEVTPDTPEGALRLRVTVMDGEGQLLKNRSGNTVLPATSGPDGVVRFDFANLGLFLSALEGKKLRFRVQALDGALGDGTYTLTLTVRTPNPHPYEVTETRWIFPGGDPIPQELGTMASFPSGTNIIDISQNQSGEGFGLGLFTSQAVGVHVFRFWTPASGPFRVWTEGLGANAANTTLRLYRARYVVNDEAERTSWWETIDFLETLDNVGPNLDWYAADRSVIDAQVLIQDADFPAYKKPTDLLGQSTTSNNPEPVEQFLDTPFLPKDRQFSDDQHVYFVVVKNEQGSTGAYRLRVETEPLPELVDEPVALPQRPTATGLRSVLSLEVPGVAQYENRVGIVPIQMPEWHAGYLGVEGEAAGAWRFGVYDADGNALTSLGTVDGERRFEVPLGGRPVFLRLHETGRVTEANDRITLRTTLREDAGLPTNFVSLGLSGVAHTLLPTNPWGELDAGDFNGSTPVDSSGRVFRFRAPSEPIKVSVTPIAGSVVSFLWGLYGDGRLVAWDLAVPGRPESYTTTLGAGPGESNNLGQGRNLLLVVRHASGSVQPAQFGITIQRETQFEFGTFEPRNTSVALPVIAAESRAVLSPSGEKLLNLDGTTARAWMPDQWMRFAVPDGPGQAPILDGLPTSSAAYPLRYDVYDAAGRVRVATGTKTFTNVEAGIALPELEGGKAYLLRLAPRDQPLEENLPLKLEFRPTKMAKSGGEFIHSVPASAVNQDFTPNWVYPDPWGDFSAESSLAGLRSVWWQHSVPNPGPVTLTALVEGSTQVRISIYREDDSAENKTPTLVDFANESSVEVTAEGKKLTLTTFLGKGLYFIEVARSNTNGGTARIDFRGPQYDLERLTPDPNQGWTLRSQMGRADGTKFFEVTAPVGSWGPATFLAYDLDLLDGRPFLRLDGTVSPPEWKAIELDLRARMKVWAVSEGSGQIGQPGMIMSETLRRGPDFAGLALKADLTTPGVAKPFQRYIIGIQSEGRVGLAPGNNSARSFSIGVEAQFEVPRSGVPDLTVETLRLLPNNGQTLVEVSVLNRGYAVSPRSESTFSYPTAQADQPIQAVLEENPLGPQSRRVWLLDWVDPSSPNDITRYLVDSGEDIVEVDETNNLEQETLKTVNAHRPTFQVDLLGFDGNSDPTVWGRYLESRGRNSVKVMVDIRLRAADADDAVDTFNGDGDIYRIRSDSPLSFTTANTLLKEERTFERVEISALAPTGPDSPNLFSAYTVDRFGLRSETVVRVIQVVPFPKWMDAGETEVEFNPDTGKYDVKFRARPVDYEATLSSMLQANVPLVGSLQNQFFVEAQADRSFSLDPNASIPVVLPSVRVQATVLGQDIVNKVFVAGLVEDHVSVTGRIEVRSDTLEASDFELTTRIDQYPVDQWEGPEIPIFGFDAGVASAAVQAQVLVDLKFDAALTFAFDLTQTNAPLRITSPSFVGLDLRVNLRFEGEIELLGFLDIASVGGGFFFTLKPRFGLEDIATSIPLEDFFDQSCLGLSATLGGELSADIFGIEVFSIELESDEIQLTDCDVATSSLAGVADAGAGLSGLSLLSTVKPLPNDSKIRMTQRVLGGDALLTTPAVRANPQLILDPSTGARLVTYLDVPTPGAAPRLYYAVDTGSGFSAPVALEASEWISQPILAATNDGSGLRAVVVYQSAPNPIATTTRNQHLTGLDLRYRYFDGTAWSEELTLTDNAVIDWQASMSFNAGGDGALVWIQNSAAAPITPLGRLTATDRVMASRWDKVAHRWGTPATVSGNGVYNQPAVVVTPTGGITVAAIQQVGGVDRIGLASRQTNGTWATTTLRDTTLPTNGRFRKIALAAESDGRVTVLIAFAEAATGSTPIRTSVLSRTGTFSELSAEAKAFQVVALTGGVSGLKLATGPGGTLVAGWQERRGEFSDVVTVRRAADGTWSRPARATLGVGDERSFSFQVAADGSVQTVFERGVHAFSAVDGTPLPVLGPDLRVPGGSLGRVGSSLAVAGPELSMTGPMLLGGTPGDAKSEGLAGTTVDALVEVRNSGGSTAEAMVVFYRRTAIGLGERLEKLGERKIRLLPGGTLKVVQPVEVRLGLNQFTAEVTLASGRDAFSNADNKAEGEITGRMDLAIEAMEVVDSVAGNKPQTGVPVGLRYEVVNRSGVEFRGSFRVTGFWVDPTKPDVTIPVNSGVLEMVLAPFDRRALPGLFEFNTAGLRWLGAEISEVSVTELSTANNRARTTLDLRPDLALRDVPIEIRGQPPQIVPAMAVRVNGDSGVGNAELRVVVSNVGSAPVRAFTLRILHAVDDGPFTVLSTETVNVPLKPGNYEILARKANALAGTNTYRAEVILLPADLPVGLPEPATFDNVAMTSVVVQGLPDLSVSAVTFVTPSGNPPNLRVGGAATVDVTVRNTGIAAAKGVVVEIFSRRLRQIGEGVLLGTGTIASVGALGSATLRVTLDTRLLQEDADSIRVVVDRQQAILEKSDLNNVGARAINVAPPIFLSNGAVLNGGAGQLSRVQSLTVSFNRDFRAPTDASILRLENVTTGAVVDPSAMVLVVDPVKRTVTWSFPGLPGGVLPAGEYVARLGVGAISDRNFNLLGRQVVVRFAVTPGDVTGDGITNERDYLFVWRELRKTEASRSLQADVDGDGKVTTADLDLVRGNYGGRASGKGVTP